MNCQRCKSHRILSIQSKTDDSSFYMWMEGENGWQGYVPSNMGIGGGNNYIEFDYCLFCGQIQGKFPIIENPSELENYNENEYVPEVTVDHHRGN